MGQKLSWDSDHISHGLYPHITDAGFQERGFHRHWQGVWEAVRLLMNSIWKSIQVNFAVFYWPNQSLMRAQFYRKIRFHSWVWMCHAIEKIGAGSKHLEDYWTGLALLVYNFIFFMSTIFIPFSQEPSKDSSYYWFNAQDPLIFSNVVLEFHFLSAFHTEVYWVTGSLKPSRFDLDSCNIFILHHRLANTNTPGPVDPEWLWVALGLPVPCVGDYKTEMKTLIASDRYQQKWF